MVAVYVITAIVGGVVGYFMERMTVLMINKRIKEEITYRFSGSRLHTVVWIILNALAWASIVYIGGLNSNTIGCVLILSSCVMISVVDITIKKIPNELILFILVVGTAFVLINGQFDSIKTNLIGFAVGFVMFFLPALIGKGAGWGDVKYAAVVGFCLGTYGFLTAIAIMTIVLIIYTGYMLISGRGNLKTKIALGPFMASGFAAVMILNIINSQHMIFDLGVILSQGIK